VALGIQHTIEVAKKVRDALKAADQKGSAEVLKTLKRLGRQVQKGAPWKWVNSL
jgi:hypothetical protein